MGSLLISILLFFIWAFGTFALHAGSKINVFLILAFIMVLLGAKEYFLQRVTNHKNRNKKLV